MDKNTKIIIVVLVVMAIGFYAFREYKATTLFGGSSEPKKSTGFPSIEELMSKGYDETEANQILTALEEGKEINY